MGDEWGRLVDRRLSQLELRGAVDDVHRDNVEKRLSQIEDTLKWLVRLIIGAMITGVIAFIVGGGFLPR
ncbi:hemolysin XhlA family protein [Roseisalinus antarcticus]|uniref:Hemolysin XhlA n=1 Tax=Roseisalinus antarcticus TaxID=254357 RepID=A0A1Y5RFH5_9RHOB|nr:hemolysin XhlA family protein [Roseisalinus antarcticus]SLN16344.1 hemolysin XhlA [Roseisalinus antarcticus]